MYSDLPPRQCCIGLAVHLHQATKRKKAFGRVGGWDLPVVVAVIGTWHVVLRMG